MVDVLDHSGARTGRVAPKTEAHRLGMWHRCAHCWILSPGTSRATGVAESRLLIQRRATAKEVWPDRLDVTVAGHLMAGEDAVEACLRELEEEVGIVVAGPGDLIPLGERVVDLEIPTGHDREFHDVFLLAKPLTPSDLRLQEEEVAAILGLRLEAAEDLCRGVPVRAERWTGRGRPGEEVEVCPSDFVPGTDEYLRRAVVRAARRVLRSALRDALEG
jgi:isopentenyldiphosphate isomerase